MKRLALAVLALVAGTAAAADGPAAVVSNVKVVSDKVPDVSSLDAWQASCIRPGMSDEQKALAVWRTVARFQHQDSPPSEYLNNGDLVQDPIKLFNVYGYSFCDVASSNVQALARHLGLEARGWTIQAHVVPEVKYEGDWHLLDASLLNYFPKPDGRLASVAEVMAAVKAWYDANPGYKGNDAALRKLHQEGGWAGWRKGPPLLTISPWYDHTGWWPAGTHGWYATMQEYDGKTLFPFESGYSQGYRVNVALRPGEKLVRNWSNRGLHANGPGGGPGCLTGKTGVDGLRHTPRFGDLTPGRVGNGTHTYAVPLADPTLRGTALACDNLAPEMGGLAVKDGGKPGVLVVRMPSSYVYLTGKLDLDALVPAGGAVTVSFSDNQGLDWTEVGRLTASGPKAIDLTPRVLRRYDYRLKFELQGAGATLRKADLAHDVQHSQAPLPVLGQGPNTVTVSAGPAEGTVTLEGSLHPGHKGKQLVAGDFHPEIQGLEPELLRVRGQQGQVTFAVATPGDLARLRFGCAYRARDARDRWELQVSFDGGKTFQTVGTAEGPKVMGAKWLTAEAPAGVRRALVRYRGTQHNTTCLMNVRIDADYREPAGGFRPVKVTYAWEEDGQAKADVHVARQPKETYEIRCAKAPVMKSVTVELAE